MTSPQGTFVWYELLAADIASAENFYKSALGWEARDAGVPGLDYRILSIDGKDVAGLMGQPEPMRAAGAPPAWFGYVAVRSVDATAKKFVGKGGKVHREPTDIPDVGRFAMVCRSARRHAQSVQAAHDERASAGASRSGRTGPRWMA